MKQPSPLRHTGPNEDGTLSVTVSVDVRVADWAALRESQRGDTEAERHDRGELSDAAVIAFAVAEGVASGGFPDGIALASVHVNYLRAAAVRKLD